MISIGIDGGGTKTRLFMQADTEEPHYYEFPISLKVQNGDFAASAEKLRTVIADLSPNENSDLPTSGSSRIRPIRRMSPMSLVIGLSGMSHAKDQQALRSAIHAFPEFTQSKIHIESDATLTLKTVLAEGEEGILLIAGTGSVVFYQPFGGSARRIGGWGPLLSDEGSGYRMGLRALRQYINVLDGVYPRDALSEAIKARIGDSEIRHSQRGLAQRAQNDPVFVASFAQDAFETAPSSKTIQDLIHEELVNLITLLFPLFLPEVMSNIKPYRLYLAGHIAQQPITMRAIEMAFDKGDLALHLVAEHAPAAKALTMARVME